MKLADAIARQLGRKLKLNISDEFRHPFDTFVAAWECLAEALGIESETLFKRVYNHPKVDLHRSLVDVVGGIWKETRGERIDYDRLLAFNYAATVVFHQDYASFDFLPDRTFLKEMWKQVLERRTPDRKRLRTEIAMALERMREPWEMQQPAFII